MAPTPIFVDLPPFEEITKRATKKTKSTGPGLELLDDVELAMEAFAQKNSSLTTSLKDLLTNFFSEPKVQTIKI